MTIVNTASSGGEPFRRVERHMSTAISLGGRGIPGDAADAFFGRVAELEDLLSRFRPASEISRLARGELHLDDADRSTRIVVAGCDELRELTAGDFEHEPRARSGNPADPVLDVNAFAKGWIIEEASMALRMCPGEFFVNAGGDVLTSDRLDGSTWRVGVQHPADRQSIFGTFEVRSGSVATSGTYERGEHIRGDPDSPFLSVSVTGPDLAMADGLATAVFAAGEAPPRWWTAVDPAYGLLTVTDDQRVRWIPPLRGDDIQWAGSGERV